MERSVLEKHTSLINSYNYEANIFMGDNDYFYGVRHHGLHRPAQLEIFRAIRRGYSRLDVVQLVLGSSSRIQARSQSSR